MSEIEDGGYTEEERTEAEKFNEMVDEGKLTTAEASQIEKDKTPEEIESLLAAKRKLATITDPDFTEFALRFVSRDEYDNIMADKKPRGEVFLMGRGTGDYGWARRAIAVSKERKGLSFNDYLENAKEKGWHNIIAEQTEWEFSADNLRTYQDLTRMFRECRQETVELNKEDNEKSTRQKTMELFRNKIVGLITNNEGKIRLHPYNASYAIMAAAMRYPDVRQESLEIEGKLNNLVGEKRANFLIDKMKEYISDNDDLRAFWDEDFSLNRSDQSYEETKALLFEFFDKAKRLYGYKETDLEFLSSFLKSEDLTNFDARTVIGTLGYAKPFHKKRGGYHALLVFSRSAVRENRSLAESMGWGVLKHDGRESTVEPHELLGAVVIMPDRELWIKTASISAKGREWAHPVFDSKGRLMYPESKNE